MLSELYQGNGTNTFSWIEGDRQLVWESRFAPSESDYFDARAKELGAPLDRPLTEEPDEIFDRLARRWSAVPVLGGAPGTEPEIHLWQWLPSGGRRLLEEGADAHEEARKLRAQWLRLNGSDAPPAETGRGREAELSAEDEAALKALGYT